MEPRGGIEPPRITLLLKHSAYMADSVSTRSARRSRFLCVGTPGAGHSCHRFCLHDRQVPFPSPDPLGTLGLPGIVSFHSQSLPHGGCDPPARMRGLLFGVRHIVPDIPRLGAGRL